MALNVTELPKGKRYNVRDADGNVIGKAELRQVPIAAIKIDSAYQREQSSDWVHKHLPFDARQAGAIVLSARAGGPYCIDGGHRLALAKESGLNAINAFVIDGLTQMDEARLFTRYQRERRNLTSFALFRADLVSGDPETAEIVRIVNKAGYHLAKTHGPKNITAIDAVRWVYRYGGDRLLATTLDYIGRMWFDEEKALSGQILKGLALFIHSAAQQPNFRPDRLERTMQRQAPTRLVRLSQAIADRRSAVSIQAANVAEAIHEQYNKNLADERDKLGPLTISGKRRPQARSR